MSQHCGYVVTVKELRKHSNADRLQVATFFNNDTIVDLSVSVGDKGIYFPSDLQLSVEFAEANNLLRKKDENGNNIGGYMDAEKRNVTAIRLRGEKSDGLYLPLTCLQSFGDITTLEDGDTIDIFNGHEICTKYIPKHNPVRQREGGSRTRKKTVNIAPLFKEHADTEQLAYNLSAFKPGDEIEITLKLHGTSARTGYLPVLQKYKRSLLDRLLKREGKPVYKWGYVCGTRRVVIDTFDGGFYGSNEFRRAHHEKFIGRLEKGETVYYEIVGYVNESTPIMPRGKNEKLGRDFVKQYGKETTFSYGCEPGESDIYVYRMTMTNEDGFVTEYSPDYMRYRCEQMGVKCVPMLAKCVIDDEGAFIWKPTYLIGGAYAEEGSYGKSVMNLAEKFYDGADPIGKTHVREGVVCRIVNRPKFTAYKHKNFSFKVLEGIIKESADVPDMEEAQELTEVIDA